MNWFRHQRGSSHEVQFKESAAKSALISAASASVLHSAIHVIGQYVFWGTTKNYFTDAIS